MNISILVFGSEHFLTGLPDQIYYKTTFNVEVIANINQAVSLIRTSPPDIILIQASLDGSITLCSWLKEQAKLSSVYCILLEDRCELITLKQQYNWEWEQEMSASALQQGADAYIWQKPDQTDATHPLLLAQLAVGVRKAQKCRDLIRTNNLLSTIALADSLTELNNRRALEWDLPRQISIARNNDTPFSLIILDVDYFKGVNDTYGHLVGDSLLQVLCTRIRQNLRSQDTPFRYGGEEFVVLLSNTLFQEAMLVANRLNRIVGEQPFAINTTLVINITISLGLACLQPEDDMKGISLLDRADKYLLKAKSSGRNRVISYEHHRSDPPHLKLLSS